MKRNEFIVPTMPRGLIRYHHGRSFHFITFSCYHRQPYLKTRTARELFEDALERIRCRYAFAVAGYVVMPEHVHLLISKPQKGTVAGVIQAIKLSVTRRRDERPFWQERYYDFNVLSEKKHIEKLRYIHRNPVKRGLVFKPEEWQWSSFRHYSTGFIGTVEIESEWTAFRRGNQLPDYLQIRK